MSLNLEEKKAVVAEVSEQIKSAQALILAEYRGVGVTKLTDLRSKARESGVYLRVLKNTLVKRAIEGTPFADFRGYDRSTYFWYVRRSGCCGKGFKQLC